MLTDKEKTNLKVTTNKRTITRDVNDGDDDDPYVETTPDNCVGYLNGA